MKYFKNITPLTKAEQEAIAEELDNYSKILIQADNELEAATEEAWNLLEERDPKENTLREHQTYYNWDRWSFLAKNTAIEIGRYILSKLGIDGEILEGWNIEGVQALALRRSGPSSLFPDHLSLGRGGKIEFKRVSSGILAEFITRRSQDKVQVVLLADDQLIETYDLVPGIETTIPNRSIRQANRVLVIRP